MRNLKLTKVIGIIVPGGKHIDLTRLRQCGVSEFANPQHSCSRSAHERTALTAFLTAYLLTRSERLAEVALCEAIESWYPDEDMRALNRLITEAALGIRCRNRERPDPVPAWMPRELQAVFELSQGLRDCFVMRVLLGFPRGTCSLLTNTDGPTVDRETTLAMISLSAATYRHSARIVIQARRCAAKSVRTILMMRSHA